MQKSDDWNKMKPEKFNSGNDMWPGILQTLVAVLFVKLNVYRIHNEDTM